MKKVYRLTSVMLVVALLSCFLCVSVSAEDLTGLADIYSYYSTFTPWDSDSISEPGNATANSVTYPMTSDYVGNGIWTGKKSKYYRSAVSAVNVPLYDVTSSVVVSFSYFLVAYDRYEADKHRFNAITSPTASIEYTNHFGNTGTGSADVYSFPVTESALTNIGTYRTAASEGLSVTGDFLGSELAPISNLKLIWPVLTYYVDAGTGDTSYTSGAYCYVTSFRVISSEAPSADLTELKNISSQIAQSNEILSAMYGDILAVCNAIYERNGSILEAQQLTNTYFEAIIPVLNSISSTTSNIYSLLSQQFSLLISTIESESDDIQSSIDNAVERLIAYFDSVFSSSVNPALPGQSDDITSQGDILGKADSDYQSSATDRFEAISADFTGFDGSVLSGVALGSTLFQRLWNVLGDYVIIYTFPLTLSICLVVVGRVSRQASRSRGGGGKKKDDSGGDTT